ncbi:hypothetical protein G7047_19365 [Diaphorobacter sp. HDW4A]|uniref:hypothetical protein n=1 Tax=Diaphorobacter sp. HDW4A TaxID=2714924 RepID=UPI00140DDDD2|nr:hypothetical protein [Diaphorobacter sp. HDW4A]QIL81835.1 hypothetical protein G7047_19365 [Diaphorobacter sp. HDW4A]
MSTHRTEPSNEQRFLAPVTRQKLSWIKRRTRALQRGFMGESRRACLEHAVAHYQFLTRERVVRNFQLIQGGPING